MGKWTNISKTITLYHKNVAACSPKDEGFDQAVRGERGPRECMKEKLKDQNGVIWTCSSRARKDSNKKKCRAKCDSKRQMKVSGVKKIACKAGIGWVEKKTEIKLDTALTSCIPR